MKKEVFASALVEAMWLHSYPRYGGFLPPGFAKTLVKLIEMGVPCNKLLEKIKPPQSYVHPDPPTHGHQAVSVATLSARHMALKDYGALVRSKKGDHGVQVVVEVLCVTNLLSDDHGLLEALFHADTRDIYTSSAIKAILQHLWQQVTLL